MGIPSYETETETATEDTESTVTCEKADGDDSPPPSSCLPLLCTGPIRLPWAGRQDRKERRALEKTRRSVEKERKRVRRSMDDWDRYRRTWRLRAAAWARGEELGEAQCRAGGFAYSTRHRYRVTDVLPSGRAGAQVVLDFRTPEGRAGALAWYEAQYDRGRDAGASFLGDAECWEEGYREYLYAGEKGQGQASLRETLLKGVEPPVYWVRTISRRMSD